MSRGGKPKPIKFEDYPDFRPNLTPKQMFLRGIFGGAYWRPIDSGVTGKRHRSLHKKYTRGSGVLSGVPENLLSTGDFDKELNAYGVLAGSSLRFWESKGWIKKSHPYGWVHWYCDFYSGKRCSDDERQIARFNGIAGPNGRFRKWLVGLVKKKNGDVSDITISPKIRQTLLQWAYELTPEDLKS